MMKPVDILLVEDKLSEAEIAIRALKLNNLDNRLLHVRDGEEALEFLTGSGKYEGLGYLPKPKLVLLDLKMPKLGGIEVLKQIRKSKQTRDIPVVVFTSSNEDPDIELCYKLGVNSYVVKPLDFKQYFQTLSKLSHYWYHINRTTN